MCQLFRKRGHLVFFDVTSNPDLFSPAIIRINSARLKESSSVVDETVRSSVPHLLLPGIRKVEVISNVAVPGLVLPALECTLAFRDMQMGYLEFQRMSKILDLATREASLPFSEYLLQAVEDAVTVVQDEVQTHVSTFVIAGRCCGCSFCLSIV